MDSLIASFARKASASILGTVLPRACVLCGSPLEGSGPPLCRACGLSLGSSERGVGERCSICGRPLISESQLCLVCRRSPPSFDEALPLFPYCGSARELISQYKFRGRRSLAPFLAGLAARALAERWPGRTVVPVPPRPGKLRERGFDQVEDLARELDRRGFHVARLLSRSSQGQQKRLGRVARSENARASFALLPRARVPREVVLLDDVITTGATAESCSKALKAGGAEAVALLTLAAD